MAAGLAVSGRAVRDAVIYPGFRLGCASAEPSRPGRSTRLRGANRRRGGAFVVVLPVRPLSIEAPRRILACHAAPIRRRRTFDIGLRGGTIHSIVRTAISNGLVRPRRVVSIGEQSARGRLSVTLRTSNIRPVATLPVRLGSEDCSNLSDDKMLPLSMYAVTCFRTMSYLRRRI